MLERGDGGCGPADFVPGVVCVAGVGVEGAESRAGVWVAQVGGLGVVEVVAALDLVFAADGVDGLGDWVAREEADYALRVAAGHGVWR